MSDIQFVRNTKYGTIGMGKNGWTKEVCNVSWNQKGPKLDLREWSPDYRKMSRGITLNKQEAKRLLAILASVDFEAFDAIALHPEYAMQIRPVSENTDKQKAPEALHGAAASENMGEQEEKGSSSEAQPFITVTVTECGLASDPITAEETAVDISDMEEDTGELLPVTV